MSNSTSDGRGGSYRRGFERSGFERAGFELWEAAGRVRAAFEDGFDRHVAPKFGQGDVRAVILTLLAEEPMHGYQLIREIETRSDGAWKPTPGSVYPTLQLLADEGLVTAQEAEGKKRYSLTESGRTEAAAAGPAPWETPSVHDAALLPKAGAKLAHAASQVAHSGTPEQIREAVAAIDEARRTLYSILAKD
ncbi:PadR family transcriptional regulator [Parafrigoribacterium soli]|uniref:PadR family transcriptional regulator n=1 Tax=Parafrigoribacterium soli TaxID=3144663 RepID=UPI0032EB251C